jgi:hypothetical protein
MPKSLKQLLAGKKLNLDQKSLDKIARIETDGVIVGTTLELLQGIRAQCETRGFLTEPQRALIRAIEKDYEDYPLWLKTCERLEELYESNAINPVSYGFVESVIAQFKERHTWSFLQKEQIIGIIQRHDAEADGEDEPAEGKP